VSAVEFPPATQSEFLQQQTLVITNTKLSGISQSLGQLYLIIINNSSQNLCMFRLFTDIIGMYLRCICHRKYRHNALSLSGSLRFY
jgi:hypothetical protein